MPVYQLPSGMDMNQLAEALSGGLQSQVGRWFDPAYFYQNEEMAKVAPDATQKGGFSQFTPWMILARDALQRGKTFRNRVTGATWRGPSAPGADWEEIQPGSPQAFDPMKTGLSDITGPALGNMASRAIGQPPADMNFQGMRQGPQVVPPGMPFGIPGVPGGEQNLASSFGGSPDSMNLIQMLLPMLLSSMSPMRAPSPQMTPMHTGGAIDDLRGMIALDSSQNVPAVLEKGEVVINKNAAKAVGPDRLNALNMAVPRYDTGGTVGQSPVPVDFSALRGANPPVDTSALSKGLPPQAQPPTQGADPLSDPVIKYLVTKFGPGFVDVIKKIFGTGWGDPVHGPRSHGQAGPTPPKELPLMNDPLGLVTGNAYQQQGRQAPTPTTGTDATTTTPAAPAKPPARGASSQSAGQAGIVPPPYKPPTPQLDPSQISSGGARSVDPTVGFTPTGQAPYIDMRALGQMDESQKEQYLYDVARNVQQTARQKLNPNTILDMYGKLLDQHLSAGLTDAQTKLTRANAIQQQMVNATQPMKNQLMAFQLADAARQDEMAKYIYDSGLWKNPQLQPAYQAYMLDAAKVRYYDSYAAKLMAQAGAVGGGGAGGTGMTPQIEKSIQGYVKLLSDQVTHADMLVKTEPNNQLYKKNLLKTTLQYKMVVDPSYAARALADPKSVAAEFSSKSWGATRYMVQPEEITTLVNDIIGNPAYQMIQQYGVPAPSAQSPQLDMSGVDVPPIDVPPQG